MITFPLRHPYKYFASFFHSTPYQGSTRIGRHINPENMSVVNKTAHPFDKVRLEALLNRRFFYAPAFEIYGGAISHQRVCNNVCQS